MVKRNELTNEKNLLFIAVHWKTNWTVWFPCAFISDRIVLPLFSSSLSFCNGQRRIYWCCDKIIQLLLDNCMHEVAPLSCTHQTLSADGSGGQGQMCRWCDSEILPSIQVWFWKVWWANSLTYYYLHWLCCGIVYVNQRVNLSCYLVTTPESAI